MIVSVPLSPVAYQVIKVPLNGQTAQLSVQQRTNGLYIDIALNGVQKLVGVLCQDRTWLVRRSYLGLPGDFCFIDTQGTSDPTYDGLGDRYALIYEVGRNAG